ncbi:hypothetical protein DL96DRAFT_1677653 [Flagelloscypha sp. PMI_526]|nr:hypothetical protein DL96DRAFT_1677653 [Flagelloscypha sp. PMI_526]
MDSWEMYCLISGAPARGEIGGLVHPDDTDKVNTLVSGLIGKLRVSDSSNMDLPPEVELREILAQVVVDPNFFPKSMKRWCSEVVVFGGFWDEDVEMYTPGVRVCSDYSGRGTFERVLNEESGQWTFNETLIHDGAVAFTDRRCWHYLQSWGVFKDPAIGRLPTFHENLWEVVFPHQSNFTETYDLDYGRRMILSRSQFSDYLFAECDLPELPGALDEFCLPEGAPNLAEAITQGLRGKSLHTALHKDLQTWIFETPDAWPEYPKNVQPPTFWLFTASASGIPNMLTLPVEVLLEVLSLLDLIDVLNTSSTCKSSRNYITNYEFFSMLIRELINHGSLFWVKPCPLVKGEVEQARAPLLSWIQSDEENLQLDPFTSSEFPFSTFIHYCLVESASMKSRRRLFGNVRQIEGWWNIHWANKNNK